MTEMKFYRYEAVQYASLDYDGDYVSPRIPSPRIELREFDLVKETLKGYWIDCIFKQKWISKTAVKRYAYPTKQEALTNFIRRIERHIEILSYQVDFLKYALQEAKGNGLQEIL